MFVNETFENIYSSLSAFRVDDDDNDHGEHYPTLPLAAPSLLPPLLLAAPPSDYDENDHDVDHDDNDHDHDHDDNCPLPSHANLRNVDNVGDLNCGTNSVNNVLQVSASGNCVEKFKNKLVEKAICLSLAALPFFPHSSRLPPDSLH